MRPTILVTGPLRGALAPRWLVAAALYRYGARPIQVRPGDIWETIGHHGVVITGGHDIDPVLYAAEPEIQPRHDPERDALEAAIIDHALQQRLPLLGICRGAQLLNARCGGNLLQELRSLRRMTSNRWTVLPLKTLLVSEGSRLQQLLETSQGRINSLHNQAIDRVGQGLQVSGRDLDSIIQAVEATDHPFLLGVQWHPEFLLLQRRQRRLFRALVQAAHQYRAGSQS